MSLYVSLKFLSFCRSKFHCVGKFPHPTYSPKNFGKHIVKFWRNIQRRFENVAICFPQIFVLYPFKISLSGKVPTTHRIAIQQCFGETYSNVFKTSLYVSPKFLSFSHSKFPTFCLFFFFCLLSLQFFHSFFFLIIPSFYFLFSQENFPSLPPLSLHTQPPLATAATLAAASYRRPCHHPLPPPFFFPAFLVFKFL